MLASEPRVLCHRDYHSRNLMLHEGQLYIIDFQDARMGPDTYDLVSLLRDSYVDLPEQTVGELIAYFLALKGSRDTEQEFRPRFHLMALQRNLKALGTFGYQTTARRNPVYIQYIPRTLRYVRDNLEHLPQIRPPARAAVGARRGVPIGGSVVGRSRDPGSGPFTQCPRAAWPRPDTRRNLGSGICGSLSRRIP